MIFSRVKKHKSAMGASMLGCFAFIGLAIWGWDLPVATAISFLVVSVVMMLVIMGCAWLTAAAIHYIRTFLNK